MRTPAATPAQFGRLARVYRWMEYLSFGPCLQQCRELRIAEISPRAAAIVYGDGDGRFLTAMLERLPEVQAVSVDASQAMLREASRRLPPGARTRLLCADALQLDAGAMPEAPFDLVISHFFLDCFRDQELAMLVERVNAATRDDAVWVISEFARPEGAIAGRIGSLIVALLYRAFGAMTGLKTRRLPDYGAALERQGWLLADRQTRLGGLLVSERWRRGEGSRATHAAPGRLPSAMHTLPYAPQHPLHAGSIPGSPPDVFPDPYPPPGPEPDGPGLPDPDPDPGPLDPVPNPAPVN